MSKPTVIAMKPGRVHSNRLYIQLKNGSVYVHPNSLELEQMESLSHRIEKNNNHVDLRNWKHVRRCDGTLVHHN